MGFVTGAESKEALTSPQVESSAPTYRRSVTEMTSPLIRLPAFSESISAPFRIAAGSNALLLVGIPEEIEEVQLLIEPLDARPATDAMDARTFDLSHADATRIAPIVQTLLDDQQGSDPRILMERIRRSRGMVDLTPKVRVEADDRTNSLIVSGPQQAVSLAGSLIEKLDRPDANSERTYATFTPRNANAERLLGTAQEVLDQTRPGGTRSSLELMLEPESGAILVVGTQGEADRAIALLQEWDANVPVLPAIDFGVITLKNAEATAVAATIGPILRDRTRWPDSLRDAMRAGVMMAEPSVTADVSGNRLLVSAPAVLQSIATTLAKQLDQDSAGDTVEVRVYPVPAGGAEGMASALQAALDAAVSSRPGEPKPVVASAGRSDAIVVTASPRLQEIVATQLTVMETSGSGVQVRTVFLKHASAARIAPLVERMLAEQAGVDPKDLPGWMRAELMMAKVRGQIPEEATIRVLADDRLNAIVVTGPSAVLNAAEQLVSQLDAKQHLDPQHQPLPVSSALTRLFVAAGDHVTASPADAARLLRALTLALTHPLMATEPKPAAAIVDIFLDGVGS